MVAAGSQGTRIERKPSSRRARHGDWRGRAHTSRKGAEARRQVGGSRTCNRWQDTARQPAEKGALTSGLLRSAGNDGRALTERLLDHLDRLIQVLVELFGDDRGGDLVSAGTVDRVRAVLDARTPWRGQDVNMPDRECSLPAGVGRTGRGLLNAHAGPFHR